MIRFLGAVLITGLAGLWSFLAWFGLAFGLGASPLAAQMPFNQATAAKRQLLLPGAPLGMEQREALARQALRHAPLSAQPLAFLALVAEKGGDDGKAQRLLDAASALGWHDEAVQRILYNWAASGDDQAGALRHAEAMLRQGQASEDLTSDFARRSADPRFRDAMVAMLSGKGKWADRWTSLDAAQLDDASLDALFASPRFRQERSAGALGTLAAQLVQSGRARLAWRLAHGPDRARPVRLDWLAEDDFPAASVFGWTLPASYSVALPDGQRQQLQRADAPGGAPASLRMGLDTGRYRITFPGMTPAATPGWRIALACRPDGPGAGGDAGVPFDFTVDAACQQQELTISAGIDASSALSAPMLQRLGD